MISRETLDLARRNNLEELQNFFLDVARDYLHDTGYLSSFEGRFIQSWKEDPNLKIYTPFVIGQKEEEIEKMKSGLLEGIICEAGAVAVINNGVIRADSIEFLKKYSQALLPFRSKIHNAPIFYCGQSTDRVEYNGYWVVKKKSFDEMSESGTFQLFKLR